MRFNDDEYYHIYNRGAHQSRIFFSPQNYRYLLGLVQKYAPQYEVSVVACCLLPNHYHFVLKQGARGSISKLLQTVFNTYVQAVNRERHHSGTLFEAKFKAKQIGSDSYALQVIRYIHLNPVETHLVDDPEAWEFSDFAAWCGLRKSEITDLTLRDAFFKSGEEYRAFVLENLRKVQYDSPRPSEGLSAGPPSNLRKVQYDSPRPSEGLSAGPPSNLRKVQEDSPKPSEGVQRGTLYLVATPIGNLDDITFRAINVLSSVDLIAAEDTRKTKILLDRYNIRKPMLSYHSYNERQRSEQLIERLLQGQSIALVSDAGTPGISDPAFWIVQSALARGIPVVPIPGPTAFISALIASGLSTDRFVFEGFLPQKKGRKTKFESLRSEVRTIIIYESPHRILKTLGEIHAYFGDRRVVVARELTKKFEEITRGPVQYVLGELSKKPPRGEYVVIIEGQRSERHT
jgi:16S rRNA (cytidine1402-2'-O)-methyltransferase